MTKANPATLFLALACLLALCTALPPVLDQVASTPTGSNAPRTFLGKPYRRRGDSRGWTLGVTYRNDSDAKPRADADADTDTSGYPVRTSARDKSWTPKTKNTEQHAQLPLRLPLVLDALSESGRARARVTKSKRPSSSGMAGPCSDDAPPFSQARTGETIPNAEGVQRVQLPMDSWRAEKARLRDASVKVGRPKRLYDRGEWKSRLLEEY